MTLNSLQIRSRGRLAASLLPYDSVQLGLQSPLEAPRSFGQRHALRGDVESVGFPVLSDPAPRQRFILLRHVPGLIIPLSRQGVPLRSASAQAPAIRGGTPRRQLKACGHKQTRWATVEPGRKDGTEIIPRAA